MDIMYMYTSNLISQILEYPSRGNLIWISIDNSLQQNPYEETIIEFDLQFISISYAFLLIYASASETTSPLIRISKINWNCILTLQC